MGMIATIGNVEVKISGMLAMAMKIDCKIDLDDGFVTLDRRMLALVLVSFRDRINQYTISHDNMYQDCVQMHLATTKLLALMDYYQTSTEDLTFA